mgnify:FL=1
MRSDRPSAKRKYPVFYERLVPVMIGVLFVLIVAMLVFAVAVGIGVLNFG